MTITKELIDLSRSIYNNVKSANSVYPTNKEESQIRVNFLIQAVCDLQCLASQLDIAKGIVEHNDKDKAIKPTVWEQWARLISTELKLVVALKKSLQGKYNLEPKPTPFAKALISLHSLNELLCRAYTICKSRSTRRRCCQHCCC